MPKLSFSNLLRKEREVRGLSLKEIAEQTKISTRFLKAIEEEKLHILPGGIFTTSFVHQYAEFLGIDQDVAITEFIRSTKEVHKSDTDNDASPVVSRFERAATWVEQYRLIVAGVLAALVLTFGGIFFWKYTLSNKHNDPVSSQRSELISTLSTTGDSRQNPQGYSESLIPSAVARATLGQTSSAGAHQQAALTGGAGTARNGEHSDMELKIASVGSVWLSILADGSQWQGIMGPNQTKQIKASESIRITVGDAGAVALSFNGKYLPALGQPGEVKHLVFTPDGPDPSL